MRYETPKFDDAVELYETPLLVDLDEAAGKDITTDGCSTGGLFGCEDIVVAQAPADP